jgi:hypothetical protein
MFLKIPKATSFFLTAEDLTYPFRSYVQGRLLDRRETVPPDAREPDGIRKPSPPVGFEPGIKALIRPFTQMSIEMVQVGIEPATSPREGRPLTTRPNSLKT